MECCGLLWTAAQKNGSCWSVSCGKRIKLECCGQLWKEDKGGVLWTSIKVDKVWSVSG